MKILVDCHVFDGMFSGVRTYIQGIYTNLVKYKDIDFYFAATNIDNIEKIFGQADNVHYIKLQHSSSLARLLFAFPYIIKKYKIDYAHFQYIAPIIKSCKEIITLHDLLFVEYPEYFPLSFRIKKGFLFYRSSKRADILFTVSEFAKKEISTYYHVDKDDIYISHNAVLPIPKGIEAPDIKKKYKMSRYILTVSRVEPRKNHLSIIRAYVELKLYNEGYKLVMIGSKDINYIDFTKYYENLPDSIKNNIIIDKASFAELVELYKHASLFIFASYAEGFGIPPLEAIEYGCPLLCSNSTAMSEFNLPDAITFTPDNLEQLKSKIIQELDTPTDLSLVRKQIKEKYNWEKIADNFYSVLKTKTY